jgi:hypothetical protein
VCEQHKHGSVGAGAGNRPGYPTGGASSRRRELGRGSVGGWGGWWGVEVVVLEAVAVSLEGEDLGVVDEPVDHCCGGGVVAEYLAPHALNGLLLVRIRLARS